MTEGNSRFTGTALRFVPAPVVTAMCLLRSEDPDCCFNRADRVGVDVLGFEDSAVPFVDSDGAGGGDSFTTALNEELTPSVFLAAC